MKLSEVRVGDVIFKEGTDPVRVESFIPSRNDVVSSSWHNRVVGTDTGRCEIHGKPDMSEYTRLIEGAGSRAPGWTGTLSAEGMDDVLVTCTGYDGNNIVFKNIEGEVYALPENSRYITKDLDG